MRNSSAPVAKKRLKTQAFNSDVALAGDHFAVGMLADGDPANCRIPTLWPIDHFAVGMLPSGPLYIQMAPMNLAGFPHSALSRLAGDSNPSIPLCSVQDADAMRIGRPFPHAIEATACLVQCSVKVDGSRAHALHFFMCSSTEHIIKTLPILSGIFHIDTLTCENAPRS